MPVRPIPAGRACCVAVILPLMLVSALLSVALVAAPAHAAAQRSSARATGDSVSLSLTNGTSFNYNDIGSGPHYQVIVTLATRFSGNISPPVTIKFENGQQFTGGNPNASADGLTYTWEVNVSTADGTNQPPTIGTHTAMAYFTNPDTGVTSQSNPVSLTINKDPFGLDCAPTTINHIIRAGQADQFRLSAGVGNYRAPFDWTQGTAAITLSGPTTVKYSNLQPDSSGIVTVTAPSQGGHYNIDCIFSGTDYYASSEATYTTYPVLVSQMAKFGGVRIYTNPTTYKGSQPFEMHIVFQAAPGLPMPTGEFSIDFGNPLSLYSNGLTIGSNGVNDITFQPNPNYTGGTNQISIQYFGDGYYDEQDWNFSGTNPPIPSGGGNGGGGGSTGSAPNQPVQPKTTATASATAGGFTSAGVAPNATATPASAHAFLASTTPFTWSAGSVAVIALIALAVVGSGVGTFLWLLRRGAAGADLPAPMAPIQPPMRPWQDEDTLPGQTMDPTRDRW